MKHLLLAASLLAAPAAAEHHETPKNVIVMVADGAGYNMLQSTRYYLGRYLTADAPEWQKASMATYALRRAAEPLSEEQEEPIVYTSERNWNADPVEGEAQCAAGYPAGFAGYEWTRCAYPDSANTMSAMMTGVRTFNGAINVDGLAQPVVSAAETAKSVGKCVGTISSVPFTHATPASGGGAHNANRGNYHEIAHEMLTADTLDFIAGGGNPDFDRDGKPNPAATPEAERYGFISPDDWAALKAGTSGWTLVENDNAIRRLGKEKVDGRVIVVPQVRDTLQAFRSAADGVDMRKAKPGTTPKTKDVPTLVDLTQAALNHLHGDSGFFLAIEGGAVDWAMHGNTLGRAIEEYEDFDDSVTAVTAWVDDPSNGSNWNNTLVIVTADHDHMLFGPDEDVPFQPVQSRGAGELPAHKWWSNSHSNQLVPFFVRGAGADMFIGAADENDAVVMRGETVGYGRYLTQAEMGQTLIDLLDN